MKLPEQEALGRVEAVREVAGQVVVSFPDFDEEEGATIERTVRVTVTRVLPDGRYWSSYEEPILVRGREAPRTVWAKASYLPVSAETADECLRAAVESLGRTPEAAGAEPSAAS
jgi:hypothetical protein